MFGRLFKKITDVAKPMPLWKGHLASIVLSSFLMYPSRWAIFFRSFRKFRLVFTSSGWAEELKFMWKISVDADCQTKKQSYSDAFTLSFCRNLLIYSVVWWNMTPPGEIGLHIFRVSTHFLPVNDAFSGDRALDWGRLCLILCFNSRVTSFFRYVTTLF